MKKRLKNPTINPFVNEQQRATCYAKDDPAWPCDEWSAVTPQGPLPKFKRGSKQRSKKVIANARKQRQQSQGGSTNPLHLDPSRTTTLRRRFVTELRKRFTLLKGRIVRFVQDEDAFGLGEANLERVANSEGVTNCNPGQIRGADGRCGPGSPSPLNIDRSEMPQIRGDDFEAFVEFARNRGVEVVREDVPARSLSPVQSGFRQERVDAIPDDVFTDTAEPKWQLPLIVSQDDRILDGTHRWVKAWQADRDATVPVIRVPLPHGEALALMRAFPMAVYAENAFVDNAGFHRPENYDKIRDLPGGKELWAGGNDWENGWTWAGVHDAGTAGSRGAIRDPGRESEPERWLHVDHAGCPGCGGENNHGSRADLKACHDWAKEQVDGWAGSIAANASSFSGRTAGNDVVLLDVPDVRQESDFDCGAAAAMSVGRYFGVGPETLEGWRELLGTDEERSTSPAAIIGCLKDLGLDAVAREGMTLADLKAEVDAGRPVVCCVQEYGKKVQNAAEDQPRDEHGRWVQLGYSSSKSIGKDPATGEHVFGPSTQIDVPSKEVSSKLLDAHAKALDAFHKMGVSTDGMRDIRIVTDGAGGAFATGTGLTHKHNDEAEKEFDKEYERTKQSRAEGDVPSYAFQSMEDRMIHEVGHNIGRKMSSKDNAEWERLVEANGQNVDNLPSFYAQENSSETFAESVLSVVKGYKFGGSNKNYVKQDPAIENFVRKQLRLSPTGNASLSNGHWLVVIGVVLPDDGVDGFVFVMDPARENVLEGSGSLEATGRGMIAADDWEAAWRDEDADGRRWERLGIAVGPGTVGTTGGVRNAFCPTGIGGGVDPSCSSTSGSGTGKGLGSAAVGLAKTLIDAHASVIKDLNEGVWQGTRLVLGVKDKMLGWMSAASSAMKGVTKAFYKGLEGRYGRTTAIAVMASGQALGWGALAKGAYLPMVSVWGSLPGAAVAETFLQVGRLGKALHGAAKEDFGLGTRNDLAFNTDDESEVDPVLVAGLAQDLHDRVSEAWRAWVTDNGHAVWADVGHLTENANPNHDELGRFAESGGGAITGEHLEKVDALVRKLTSDMEESGLSFAHGKMEQYQWGTSVHKESMLDEVARGHFDSDKGGPSFNPANMSEKVREHFQPLRDLLRSIVGDHVTLYRGADAVGGIPGKKLSSYAADDKVAKKFMWGQDVTGKLKEKVLKEVKVPIDAIYLAIRTKNRPLEFLIDNDKLPKHLSANASSFSENETATENSFCPTGEGGGVDPSCSPGGFSVTRDDEQRYESKFDAPTGEFTVSAQRKAPFGDDNWLVRFTLKQASGGETEKLTGKSGTGAVSILRTVASSVDDFVGKHKPTSFEFTADASEGSRVRLYDTASQLIARRHGYDLKRIEGPFVKYRFDKVVGGSVANSFLLPFETEWNTVIGNTSWTPHPYADNVNSFQAWLQQQTRELLTSEQERQCWGKYAQDGWRKGVARSFDDVNARRKVLSVGDQRKIDFHEGSRDQFLRDIFNQFTSTEQVASLARRSFDDLKGITDQMILRMSQVLTDGLGQGKRPPEVAEDLMEEVNLAEQHAASVATGRCLQAHEAGRSDALKSMGVKDVVRGPWLGDNGQESISNGLVSDVGGHSHDALANALSQVVGDPLEAFSNFVVTGNAFCPTGSGGGVDPSCSPHALPTASLKEGIGALRGSLAKYVGLEATGEHPVLAEGESMHGGSGSSGDKIHVAGWEQRAYDSASGKEPKDWNADETHAVKTVHHELIHTLGTKDRGFAEGEQQFESTSREVPSSTGSGKMVKAGVGLMLEEAPTEMLARDAVGSMRGKPWSSKKDGGAYQQYVAGMESLAKHARVDPVDLARQMKSESVRDRLHRVGKMLGGKDGPDSLERGNRYVTEVLSHGNDHPIKKKDFADVIKGIVSGTTANTFCPTGAGGGVDPLCSPSAAAGTPPERVAKELGKWPHGASIGLLADRTGLTQKAVRVSLAASGAVEGPKGVFKVGTPPDRVGTPGRAISDAAKAMPVDGSGSTDHASHVVDAVRRHGLGDNLVPLGKVREHLASVGVTSRVDQDAVVLAARKAGHVSLIPLEGRHGTTEQERRDSIVEPARIGDVSDVRHGFVSMRHGG